MSQNSYLCNADRNEACLFCLCGSDPVFICPTCLPKHEGHDVYPITQSELFQAIGKDKEELQRRNVLSKKSQVFLDRVMDREAAVQTQAKALMMTVSQNYGMWLEGNHRCFESLLRTMREETALLLTRPKYRVSSITQKLFEKVKSLDSEGEKRFTHIPEMERLKSLSELCQEACSRAYKVWQEDYEEEVFQALTAQPQANKRKRSLSVHNEEVELLTIKLEETKDQFQSLQTDFQAKTQHCISLESQVNELNLSLEKSIQRIAELVDQQKELSTQMDTTKPQFQELQRDLQVKVQNITVLIEENKALTELSECLSTRLNDSESSLDSCCREITTLETQRNQLTTEFDVMKRDFQVLQTDFQTKQKRLTSLEQANKTLRKKSGIGLGQNSDALLTKAIIDPDEASQKISVLEARLIKWGITNDPPNESQQSIPDYSTPESRSAAAKFGPYSDQDDELLLVKRGPIAEKGGVYIGQWNTRNEKHGYGKFLFNNGNVYEGQWRNGNKSGKGRFIWSEGAVYVGDFLRNQREGFGTFYYANGDEYSGNWLNGKRHGIGSWKFGEASQAAGDRYIGEYIDGKRDGIGAGIWANGVVYLGSWKADALHGKGLMGWPDGSIYNGNYENNVKSGAGCCLYLNGDVYKGEWKDSSRNGQGRLTHPGIVQEGVWISNILTGEGA